MSDNEMSLDFQKAFGLLNVNHYKAAIEYFQQDLNENPNNFASLNNMALAKIHIGIGQANPALLLESIDNLESAIQIFSEVYNYDGYFIAHANLKWAKQEFEKLNKTKT